MTEKELKINIKKTAQAALNSEYGFKPGLDRILLLECNLTDRTYIRFSVSTHEYVFRSYTFEDGSVWVGKGTIEKVS